MATLWRAVTGVFSLHDNAAHGRIGLLRSALALRWKISGPGAWIDAADPAAGTTALHAASYNGHLAVVRMLVSEYGASTTVLTHDGWSALHCAAINGYLPVVRYLLEDSRPRVSPGLESKEGWTALHCAAAHGFLPVVKYLVETARMDVDLPTYSGWTALHWACCNGYLPVVKYLLHTARADRNALTRSCGSNIMHVAARQGQLAIVEYLCSEELVPLETAATAAAAASSSASSSSPAASAAASSASIAAISVPIPSSSSSSASASASASADDPLESVSISVFLAPGPAADGSVSAVASQPLTTRPILARAAWVALNDGGASPFLLAALRGKLPLVLFLAGAIGRDRFSFEEIQKAHDAHQVLARAKGRMLNHQLMAFLREWMSDITYRQTVHAAPSSSSASSAAAASSAASSSSSSTSSAALPTLDQVDAESRRLRELMLAHERGERPDLGLDDDEDESSDDDEDEEEQKIASLDAVAEEDDELTDSDADEDQQQRAAGRAAPRSSVSDVAVMCAMDNAHVVRSPLAADADVTLVQQSATVDEEEQQGSESAVHRMLEEYARSHAGVLQPLTRPGSKAPLSASTAAASPPTPSPAAAASAASSPFAAAAASSSVAGATDAAASSTLLASDASSSPVGAVPSPLQSPPRRGQPLPPFNKGGDTDQ